MNYLENLIPLLSRRISLGAILTPVLRWTAQSYEGLQPSGNVPTVENGILYFTNTVTPVSFPGDYTVHMTTRSSDASIALNGTLIESPTGTNSLRTVELVRKDGITTTFVDGIAVSTGTNTTEITSITSTGPIIALTAVDNADHVRAIRTQGRIVALLLVPTWNITPGVGSILISSMSSPSPFVITIGTGQVTLEELNGQ